MDTSAILGEGFFETARMCRIPILFIHSVFSLLSVFFDDPLHDVAAFFEDLIETTIRVHDEHIIVPAWSQRLVVQLADLGQILERDVTLFRSASPFQPF